MSAVTRFIAEHRERIATTWRGRVATISESTALALVERVLDFLRDRNPAHVRDHACRLDELSPLREVLMTELLAHVHDDPRGIVEVNVALDLAGVEAVQRLARREELRERFVGILGHDLRNPLMALTLSAEAILSTPSCTQASHGRHALAIRNGGERMSQMISALVDFAQSQLGDGIDVALSACDMGLLAREAVEALRATNPERDIRLDMAGKLAGTWDPDRVVQVIANLVGNAIAHGKDPTIARVFETDDGNFVITEIHNAGPPIAESSLDVLFDPFKRPKPKRGGGLGLGLYLVDQIARAHGAGCTVDSTIDRGTTFRISWPRAVAAA